MNTFHFLGDDDHHRKGSQRILHIYLSYTTQEEWLNKVNCIFPRNLLHIFFVLTQFVEKVKSFFDHFY